MNTDNFETIKAEILRHAKDANACAEQYRRALGTSSLPDLMQVVKDNFNWCCTNKVITISLIETYHDDFASCHIYANKDARDSDFVLCVNSTVAAYDSSTVMACVNSTVEACDNSTVYACDNATVMAWDISTVMAWDISTVEAWGNSTVKAHNNSTVKAHNNSTVKAFNNSTVKVFNNSTVYAYGSSTVEACDSSTVMTYGSSTVYAYGNACCISYHRIKCKLHDNAIHRVIANNTIYFASDNIKFIKQDNTSNENQP